MQIVKVEPLAKINAIFSERMGADECNIDGFDTREEGRRRRRRKERSSDWDESEKKARISHYSLNHLYGSV